MKKTVAVLITVVAVFVAVLPAWALGESQINLVDEPFELIATIFRLAGHEEYTIQESDYRGYGVSAEYVNYQRALNAAFTEYKDHPAVQYASTLDISGSDIFKYTLYIKENLGGFADDASSLFRGGFGGWGPEIAANLWSLALDFYNDTGFAEFYRSNIPFYQELTAPFIENKIVSSLDTGWFRTVAKGFEDLIMENYRYIVTPSLHIACMNAWKDDTTYAVMAAILGQMEDGRETGALLVHEYCHSFCNGPAIDGYMTNEQFATWCDTTDTSYGIYNDPITAAVEYMVRAYTLLYFDDHRYDDIVTMNLAQDKRLGFTYIEEVYYMVREAEGRE